MPTLTFKQFETAATPQRPFLFSDLHLDLEQQRIQHPGLTSPTIGKDIKLDYDLAAILNSLNNLFNTIPGQRFLLPEYGLNLVQYLFGPVSKKYGDIIGNNILDSIKRWEPRVNVTKVLINALPEQNEYDIALALYVPAFKQYVGLVGKLAQNGFSPLRTVLR